MTELPRLEAMRPNIDIFALPVHPDADLFPMIDEDEMEELAQDVKDNGLNEPLVISWDEERDEEGWILVDGRNRREACRRAGIEPHYRILETDPKAYIVSVNIHRRHMTKGQRAMAVAMMYPEPEARGRGKKSQLNCDFNRESLRQARTVLRTLPDLAPQVLSGATPLNKAYAQTQAEQRAAQSEEAKFNRLKTEAPDLAELVVEERMPLAEAIAALERREQIARDLQAPLGRKKDHALAEAILIARYGWKGQGIRGPRPIS